MLFFGSFHLCSLYSPIARCSLCPKHWSLRHPLTSAANFMLAALSVVMQTSFPSFNPHSSRASLSPWAMLCPVWSSGMNAVWRHLTLQVNSVSMKCTVRLIYGSIVRLHQRSVVAAKLSAVDTSSSTSFRHLS